MHRFVLAAVAFFALLYGLTAQGFADETILIKEVFSRETSIIRFEKGPGINEVFSKEVSLFVPNGRPDEIREITSRSVGLLNVDSTAPAPIEDLDVTLSPTGDTAVLDWSSYDQWSVGDVVEFVIYYSSDGPITDLNAEGLNTITVSAETTTVTIENLPEFTDHFFVVVPVDGLGNSDPDVSYAAGYVLCPEVVSREMTLFVDAGPRDVALSSPVSRSVSIVSVTNDPPDIVDDPVITVSGDGSTVTLDWESYDQWSQADITRFDIYYTSDGPFDTVPAQGLSVVSVSAESTSVTLEGLTAFTDYYFAVVPVDGLGNYNETVVYSASYVLSPQVISREVSLFTGNQKPIPFQEIISRAASILTPDSAVPDPVTGSDSGFSVETASDEYSAVILDWSSYEEAVQLDVLQYDIYVSTAFFTDVTGMVPFASVGAGIQQYTLSGLPGGAIRYFAVVAKDAMGNYNATVYARSGLTSVSGVGEVSNLAVQSDETSLTFTWDPPEGAGSFLSHYLIYFGGSTEPLTLAADQTSWTTTDLSAATGYPFKITTVDKFGNESQGNSVTGATWLANPENVSITADGDNVYLTWDAAGSSGLLQYYAVYKDSSPIVDVTGLTPVTTLSGTQASLGTISDVSGYYFAVAAVNVSDGLNPAVSSVSGTKESQTVNFTEPVAGSALTATATSGLLVRFVSSNTSIATVDSDIFTVLQGGPVTVTAIQDGNEDYWPAKASYTLRLSPVITGVTAQGAALGDGFTFTTATVTVAVTAADADGIAMANIYGRDLPDGAWRLLAQDTSAGDGLSGVVPVSSLTDGDFELRVAVHSTTGYSSQKTFTGELALSLPDAPNVTQPVSGLTTSNPILAVAGTVSADVTSVKVYQNGTLAATLSAFNGSFSGTVTLTDGNNELTFQAVNRKGAGPLSAVITVTLDRSVPESPKHLKAQSQASGVVSLSWSKPLDTTVAGYHLYRSDSAFTTVGQAALLNTGLITATLYKDLPGQDGIYYYAVTAVDYAGNESPLSSVVSGGSDRVAPQAVSIEYSPTGPYDAGTGRMGPGIVYLTLRVSEPLATTPFLSINPVGAVPMTVDLDQDSDLVYSGLFVIDSDTPTGTAYAVFSAKDEAGNRGDSIASGGSVTIDTDGPVLADIRITPGAPVKNEKEGTNPVEPVDITVVLGLTEAVKDGQAPALAYTLSITQASPVTIDAISRISTMDGHAQTWQAAFTLPANAGEAQAETLKFTYSAVDDLDNLSGKITAANTFQVYQGDLPPLDVPENFTGTGLPLGKIKLSWDAVDLASGYKLYRMAPGESELTELATLGAVTEYTDEPETEGTYTYALASLRHENGETAQSDMCDPINVVSDATAPDAPTNFTLTLTPQGIQAAWTPSVSASTQTLTYSLYRGAGDANTVFNSVEGLVSVHTGIEGIAAIDTSPSASHHCYAVTAVDQAGNESVPSGTGYLDFELLPVETLTVIRVDDGNPEISWTHSGSSIAGYDIYQGPEGSAVQLNTALVTASVFTDETFDGSERRYTVFAENTDGQQSLGRSIVLPLMTATLGEDASLRRGLMNRLDYIVTNSGSSDVADAVLRVTVEGVEHVSQSFDLGAGQSLTVPVVVGGYSDLPDTAALYSAIEITPNEGELVQIGTNSEISVGIGMLQLSFTNNEFVRGGTGQIAFTLENTGDEEIEIVTAESDGSASLDITLYLSDEDGNILSTGTYTQVLGSSVVKLANGRTVARIASGDRFESQAMAIDVPANAPDELELTLEISSVYYHLGEDPAVEMDGVQTGRDITLVDTAYTGELLSIDPDESLGDQDIVITGQAVDRNDGAALAEVPLTLVITLDGFERTVDVFTGSDGCFSYPFEPSEGEYGEYQVCVIHPDLRDRPVQGSFTITDPNTARITFTPGSYELTMARNYTRDIVVTLTAGEAASATHLAFEASDIPQGIHVDTGDGLSSLGAGETGTITISLWADNTAEETLSLTLTLVSDEQPDGSLGTLAVDIGLTDVGPILSYTPSAIETSVALDDSVTENLALENQGFIRLTDLAIELVTQDDTPVPDWALLNQPSGVDALDVGESMDLSVVFAPIDGSAAEGDYDFYVRVTSSNYTAVDIPVRVTVSDSGIGNILFKVSDIYTGTKDENNEVIQGLAGANLTLAYEADTSQTYSGQTDQYGELTFSDLPTGRYKYRLTADNHDQVIGRVWIKPDITATEDVFMGYNLVSVEWSVVETSIQDKYEVVLNATYETDVPAAVVIAEPASITLPDMEPGDVLTGEIRFTNYGLIRAEEIEFTLPESNEYFKYELLANIPDTIEAKESITVPYRVTCLASLTGNDEGAGGDCFSYGDETCLWYLFECTNGSVWEEVRCVRFVYIDGDCFNFAAEPGDSSGGPGFTITGFDTSYTPPEEIPIGVICRIVAVCEVDDECCKEFARDEVASYVNLMSGDYEDDEVDLFLKIPGETLAVRRYYYDQEWHFKNVGSVLGLNYDSANASIPYTISKDGVKYEKSDALGTVYTFNKVKHIFRDADGFLWKDKLENWIRYDLEGRVKTRGNHDQTYFTYVYDSTDPDRLSHIEDNKGNAVLWYDYTADGQVKLVEDGYGRQVSYDYDADGRLTQVTDVLENTFQYTYDENGWMISKTDPAGRTTQMEYNAFGWVSAIVDDKGNRTSYSYAQNDAQNEIYAMVTYPNGRVKEIWYDELGRVTRTDLNGTTIEENVYGNRKRIKTDERGYKTIYEFDEWNQLIKKTYPDGSVEETEYDPATKLKVRRVKKNGTVVTYEYDDDRNLTRRVQAPGTDDEIIHEFTYDEYGNELKQTTVMGDESVPDSVIEMAYDGYGNMTSSTDPEGNTTTYTHNYLGMPLTKTDPRGNTWTYEYDNAGNLITETGPSEDESEPNVITYTYDAVGNRTTQTDPLGGVVQFAYDIKDRLVKQTDPLGNETVYQRDFEGKVLQQTDAEGSYLVFGYDNLGRLISKGTSAGKQATFEYDQDSAVGCPACSGSGTGEPSVIQYPTMEVGQDYDRLGRKIRDRYEPLDGTAARERTTEYDETGNVTAVTDMNGLTTSYEYDAVGRKVKEIRPGGTSISYTYDEQKNMTGLTDANGHTTAFEYDLNNRLVKETRPGGQETTYTYDENGNLASRTDAKGQVTAYDYNAVNKLAAIRYINAGETTASKTVTFTWDMGGNMTGYSDGTLSAEFTYDRAHQKTSATVHYGSFTKTYAYAYYGNGLVKSFTGPDGITVDYTHTKDNRISTISIPDAGIVSYNAYEWSSPASILLPGGTLKEFEYDAFNQAKAITAKDPGGTSVMDLGYELDNQANVTSISSLAGTVSYAYDNLYRLVRVDDPARGITEYTFDGMNNRMSPGTWAYNTNDQLTAGDGAAYTYDANGNVASKETATDKFYYTYDHENRLIKIQSDSAGEIAAYGYDPFGRRISKEVGGVNTFFIYADEGLVGECDDDGDFIRTYGYVPGTMNSYNPVFMRTGDDCFFYHTDRIGKPVKMTDINGITVWSADYDVYGTARVDAGSTITNPLRLPGHYRDEESGLHYNYFRYYDPSTGRYLQPDPLGLGNRPVVGNYRAGKTCFGAFSDIDINYYVYADANPGNKIDPFGTRSVSAGFQGSTGCMPVMGLAGFEISGKLEAKECCDCETMQMDEVITIEACIAACVGVAGPGWRPLMGVGKTTCCPKEAEGSAKLYGSCNFGPVSCSVDIPLKPFPPSNVTGNCATGTILGFDGSVDLGALSCSAGGCASVSF